MRRILQALWLGLVTLSVARGAQGQELEPRTVIMLYPGLEKVWGSYYFAVNNQTGEPVQVTHPVLLPKETTDFQAQEGVSPEALSIEDDGTVTLNMEFPAGFSVVNVGFLVEAGSNETELTFRSPQGIDQVTIMTQKGNLDITSGQMELGEAPPIARGEHVALHLKEPLSAEKALQVTVGGIPEGRSRLWIIGWVFGALALVLPLSIAWATRPKYNLAEA